MITSATYAGKMALLWCDHSVYWTSSATEVGLLVEQQRPNLSQIYIERWFNIRVQLLGAALVFLVCVFVVLGRGHVISTAGAALAVSFALQVSGNLGWLFSSFSEFAMGFNCVERIMEYCSTLPQEAPAVVEEHQPPPGWPTTGRLEVKNLRMQYRADLPLVLNGLTFTVEHGEHIGIVGRTGAGKSSLLLAIFRIVEPMVGSGLYLDGQDLLSIGLHDLRRSLAMIPQEPVLFQATIRYNCDPYDKHSSEAIWQALEDAQLAPWLRERAASGNAGESSTSGHGGLNFMVSENGQNLSVGQRQMVALARAVLRQSQLVVLDEATAAIDAATDAAIQQAVRKCFCASTTLTIAHRLQTIIDSDRVMVLQEGVIAEFDHPDRLLAQEDGIFSGMVRQSEGRR